MIQKFFLSIITTIFLTGFDARAAEPILVEAESFENHGGWKLDTQFIEIMGSPYLMAHGLGRPVADAATTITVPEAGEWKIWVRTKDWVAHWEAEPAPGRVEVIINGSPVETTFGTKGAEWHWQSGGKISLPAGKVELSLHDLTGFNGRCDAIYLTMGTEEPDNSSEILPAWRREALGIEVEPIEEKFDIAFIGGGYAGTCGAISAARMGLKTALIQNRDVLGGNGSSEVRVWAKGNTPGGLYPVGDIVQELSDQAKASPGTYEEYEDDKKLGIVRKEKNLSLFLGHHAFAVDTENNNIQSVSALETRTGKIRKFEATYYCDSTGHGYIGLKAGADTKMIEGGRMGMSNMWNWAETDEPVSFPETPWALKLDENGFPYPRKHHAEWFWESGYDKHPLNDLELIRDWNLRANFGAWNAIKNNGAYARSDESGNAHANATLTWMAYVGGTRETLQLLGDVVLTEEDILTKREFPDRCVLSTWSIDLHYPKEQYIGKYKDNPFISYAEHGRGVDRRVGYAVPYRCFYSRNIENLFMAGRNVSVTHKALGTVRVMKTGGMMGVVVGKAAAVAKQYDTTPRGVYEQYLPELIELLKIPGQKRRPDINSPFVIDPTIPKYEPSMSVSGVPLSKLDGMVVDDEKATMTGKWTRGGAGLKGFVNMGYSYTSDKEATASYDFTIPDDGTYDVRVSWQPHENRSANTTIQVNNNGDSIKESVVNQKEKPLMKYGFHSLGRIPFKKGDKASVVILGKGATGNVHADAVQLVKK
ncbi:MAG: FAD-dependent oxidoreductase [Verrucomicrobiales bacterium]|nr:FAD-dependent oxidoreductase [Verrucomicrobiales bacterium]